MAQTPGPHKVWLFSLVCAPNSWMIHCPEYHAEEGRKRTVRSGCIGPAAPTTHSGVCTCAVAQLCLTFGPSLDYDLPGSFVHRGSQARMLDWVAIFYARGSSPPRGQTQVSCVSGIGRCILYCRATWEAPAVAKNSVYRKKYKQMWEIYLGYDRTTTTTLIVLSAISKFNYNPKTSINH